MVPNLIHDVGRWLDVFSEVLERWESTLNEVQGKYLEGNFLRIAELCPMGEGIHLEVQECKARRDAILTGAFDIGYSAQTLKALSIQMDGHWPALWTHRLANLEHQLHRIQQLSMSLWVTAFQSKSYVSELLLILSTGTSVSATYSPSESHSLEGGFLINEAA